MPQVSSKLKTVKDVTAKPRPVGPLANKMKQRENNVLPEVTQQGAKKRIPIAVPGVKTN